MKLPTVDTWTPLAKWKPWRSLLLILAGSGLLIGLEILEEPELSLGEILIEMIQPALIVLTAVGVVRLGEQMRRQREEQMLLIRDLEAARAEGERWRRDVHDLIRGLGVAIDEQFDQWGLTEAEREVALLMLKGLSYKEIAVARDVSERTVRQQAHGVFRKARLSGRAALSAFFLEDLLLPQRQPGGAP